MSAADADPRTISHLRTEGLRNPIGIGERKPILTFRRPPGVSRFRVRAVDDADRLLWESDWQEGPAGSVIWGGGDLESRSVVSWSVEAETEDGDRLRSEAGRFEVGLLSDADWRGRWIAVSPHVEIPSKDGVSGARYFRRDFELPRRPTRGRLYIAGLGFHRATLASRPITDRILEPGFTRYDKRVLYCTYDVGDMLAEGANVLTVEIANGWYNEEIGSAWDFDRAPWRDEPKLLYQLEVTASDGSITVIAGDEDTLCGSGPVVSAGIRSGISIDLGRSPATVDRAVAADPPRGTLSAQGYPPVRVTEGPAVKAVTAPSPHRRLFDFGENLSGGLRVELTPELAPGSTEAIRITYGERVDDEGNLDNRSIAGLTYGRFQTDELIGLESIRSAFETRHCYHGFRYAQIDAIGASPQVAGAASGLDAIRSVTALRMTMDFERIGELSCSDERINRLVQCAERSYVSNFHSIPTDCPHREKNGWTADAHLATPFGLYTYRSEAAYRKWMDDFADEQRADGALPGIIPTSGWGYEWGNGPAWDSAYILVPYFLQQFRGDLRTAVRHMDNHMRYLHYVNERRMNDKAGIVRFGLGDWVPPYGKPEEHRCPVALTSTAFFYRCLMATAELAAAAGRRADADWCRREAAAVWEAFDATFYSDETGGYGPEDITSLAVPIHFGLAPEGRLEKTGRRLVDVVESEGNRFQCGVVGSSSVLHALSMIGRTDLAYRMLTTHGYPGYMDWLDRGATTLWESHQGTNSLNHVFFADALAWLYRRVAGLVPRPVETDAGPRMLFEPFVPEGLDAMAARHEGPAGEIALSFERSDGAVELDIESPLPGEVRIAGTRVPVSAGRSRVSMSLG